MKKRLILCVLAVLLFCFVVNAEYDYSGNINYFCQDVVGNEIVKLTCDHIEPGVSNELYIGIDSDIVEWKNGSPTACGDGIVISCDYAGAWDLEVGLPRFKITNSGTKQGSFCEDYYWFINLDTVPAYSIDDYPYFTKHNLAGAEQVYALTQGEVDLVVGNTSTKPCSVSRDDGGNIAYCGGGTQTCSNDIWGACVFPTEDCDGEDNDCDWFVDEDWDCIQNQYICLQYGAGDVCTEWTTYCDSACNIIPLPNIVPTANISSPVSALVGTDVTISGNCSDDDGDITRCDISTGNSNCLISNKIFSGIGTANANVSAVINCNSSVNDELTLVAEDNGLNVSYDKEALFYYAPVSANPSLEIINTPPTAPEIDLTSERKISGNEVVVIFEIPSDPDTGFTGGQTILYSAYISPGETAFPSGIESNLITKSGLDRTKDNCLSISVSDGVDTLESINYACFPVIDSLIIENTTSPGDLNGTSWIKNHFGTVSDPYEKITCSFVAHDVDTSDLDYNMKLVAKIPGEEGVVVESRTGSLISGSTKIENFTISKFPQTNHGYVIGTRFYCDLDLNDGILEDEIQTFSGTSWTIKGPLEGDTTVPNGFIEVVNTIPQMPAQGELDRYDNSTRLGTTIGESKDPDVFDLLEGGQDLSYYGRIFDTSSRPAYDDGTNLLLGDFNLPDVGESRFFSIPLLMERVYSFEGRSFDGMEYSPILDYDSNETPFQPVCYDLGFNTSVLSVDCDVPTGKTSIVFSVTCDKDRRMDEDWTVGVSSLLVKENDFVIGSTLLNSVVDCNSDPQLIFTNIDANKNTTYYAEFVYGGIYNSQVLNCTYDETYDNVVTVTNCSGGSGDVTFGNPASCALAGFVPVVSDINFNTLLGETKMTIQYLCSNDSTINKITFKDAQGSEISSTPLLDLTCDSTVRSYEFVVSTTELGAYSLEIDYTHAPDTCTKSIVVGIKGESEFNIPDSNIFVILLVLLIVSIIIISKKEDKK